MPGIQSVLLNEDRRIRSACRDAVEVAKTHALGRDAILHHGKFAGRRCRITMVSSDDQGLLYLLQPYRLDGRKTSGMMENDDLLWDDPQARSYHRTENFEFIFE